MANWMRTLDISDVWDKAQEDEITPQELSKVIADRLEKLDDFMGFIINRDKQTLVRQFRNFSGNADDFDELMGDLYDWGDTALGKGRKVCWIKCA